MNFLKRHPVLAALLAVTLILALVVGIVVTRPSKPKQIFRAVICPSGWTPIGSNGCGVPSDLYRTGGCLASTDCACSAWVDADSATPSLVSVVANMADGTIVDFDTNGCYEVSLGVRNSFTAGNAVSFNGNPSNLPGENAELFDNDNGSAQESIVLETQGSGAVIQHLTLVGANTRGGYNSKYANGESGVGLVGSANNVVNDVSVTGVYADCLNTFTSGGFVTNLLVENFVGNYCGRMGMGLVSDDGARICGSAIGRTGFPDSYDFENDTVGNFQGSENIVITGSRCTNYNPQTGTVVTQGCYFDAFVTIKPNPKIGGPYLINNCVSIASGDGTGGAGLAGNGEGGSLTVVEPNSAESHRPNGPVIFSNDQLECGYSGSAACIILDTFDLSLRGTTMLAGDTQVGDKEIVYQAGSSTSPIDADVQSGTPIKWNYDVKNNGTDSLKDITVNGNFCGSATFLSSSAPKYFPTASSPFNVLPSTDKWSYQCKMPVTATTTDTGTLHAVDASTNIALPDDTDSFTVTVGDSSVHRLGARRGDVLGQDQSTPGASDNLSESASGVYGSQLSLSSDCFAGQFGDPSMTPPFGNVSQYSSARFPNTPHPGSGNVGFFPGGRKSCPVRTEIWSNPTTDSITLGASDTDSSMIAGEQGPNAPTGSLAYYVCGPTVTPEPCTSTTPGTHSGYTVASVGSGTLAVQGGANGLTSTSTSPSYTPGARGFWCFAAYYPQTAISGGTGVFEASADQSVAATDPITETDLNVAQSNDSPFVMNAGYDGCYDVT